jgi:hypothetical protein
VDFGWLEQRLRALDVHLVLCTRRDGTWEAAREERLPVSGKPSQYDDLDVFRREQDLLRRLAGESILPVLELDMSDGDIEGACNGIAEWKGSTGGLWPLGHAPGERSARQAPRAILTRTSGPHARRGSAVRDRGGAHAQQGSGARYPDDAEEHEDDRDEDLSELRPDPPTPSGRPAHAFTSATPLGGEPVGCPHGPSVGLGAPDDQQLGIRVPVHRFPFPTAPITR